MQTEHSGNDPELPSVAQLSDRSRRKGRRQYNDRQKHQQRQLLSQQQLQKHQQLQLLSQCTELEAQLRASVRGEGTTAERMVKVFRAALHSFRVLVKGHALSSVQSAIYRELNGNRHSDSMTREYCSGTAHQQRVGLTDYCMCGRGHTASMTSTTVGAVLIKHSTRWFIRRQVHSWWLYWRERHLLAAQQMATVAARTPSTETGGADTEGAAAEGAASEGAAAEDATAEQNCAPDSSNCSVQLMAAFALMHKVWEQHWGTVSEYEGGVHPDYCSSRELSRYSQGSGSWGMEMLIESKGWCEYVPSHLSVSVSEIDKYQATKVAAWETAVAACQQAIQQLQQAKDAQRNSALSACTPEQALSQYHPSAALEFRQQTQGIAEKAQREEKRRNEHRRVAWSYGSTGHIRDALWQERAAQATRIAQELKEAATESVEALEAVLHSQSWDHRVVSEMHSSKLREMEMDSFQGEQVKQVELQQGRLQVFMAKIRRQEREDQREMAKEKKTIQFKQQELVILEP